MEKKEYNLFGYIDELAIEDLYMLQQSLLQDIEYLKMQNNDKQLDFEIERLRYVNKLVKEKNKELVNSSEKLSM